MRIDALYRMHSYMEAYSRHTDLRVERDPRAAVGGRWEEIGRLQFEFLLRNGLEPRHKLLDIGCGTLRGGRHFIRHLDAGNYSGMDISPRAIEFGLQLVEEEGLAEKRPRLLVNRNKDLKLTEFKDEKFDFLLAQSVFTHLKAERIEECFQHVGRIMHQGSVFFFTFKLAPEAVQTERKTFRYPFGFFHSLAVRHNLAVKDRSADYNHPRGQQMAALLKGEAGRP
jgi:SAM-dependent methyltransferase